MEDGDEAKNIQEWLSDDVKIEEQGRDNVSVHHGANRSIFQS